MNETTLAKLKDFEARCTEERETMISWLKKAGKVCWNASEQSIEVWETADNAVCIHIPLKFSPLALYLEPFGPDGITGSQLPDSLLHGEFTLDFRCFATHLDARDGCRYA